MCDVLNLNVDPPTRMLELTIPAINDFVRDPSDWQKFESLDKMLRIFLLPKWGSYAFARFIGAARAESGAEREEIVDLTG